MKVIFQGEVKEVKPGYFRNFLLPRKLAEPATHQKIKELEALKKNLASQKEKFEKAAREELQKAGERILEFEAAADEKGNLYKGISAKDIAGKYKNIKPEWILLQEPIKKTGEYEVKIKLPPDNTNHLYVLHLAVKADFSSV